MGNTYVPGLGEVSEDQLIESGEFEALQAGGGEAAQAAQAVQRMPDELGVQTVWEARPLGARDFLKADPFLFDPGSNDQSATLLYQVPAGYCGVIRGFSYNAKNLNELNGVILVSVIVGGRPSDSQQLLNYGAFINLTPCYEVADEGQTIGIRLDRQGVSENSIYGNFAIHGNVIPKKGVDKDTGLGSPQAITPRGMRRVFSQLFRKPVAVQRGTFNRR